MLRIIHLSDLHIHRDANHPDNQNAQAIMRHLIRYKDDGIETHIVITGDSIDDGRADQLVHFMQEFNLLRMYLPVHVCPGNHDYGDMGNYPRPASIESFGKAIAVDSFPIVRFSSTGERTAFIGLDSADPLDTEWFAEGVIGKRQLSELDEHLAAAQNNGQMVVLYLHHHPFYRVPGCTLADSQELLNLIAGRVGLVLFGHRHVPDVYWDSFGVRCMVASGKSTRPRGNSLCYRIILVEGGTVKGVYTEQVKARVQEAA